MSRADAEAALRVEAERRSAEAESRAVAAINNALAYITQAITALVAVAWELEALRGDIAKDPPSL